MAAGANAGAPPDENTPENAGVLAPIAEVCPNAGVLTPIPEDCLNAGVLTPIPEGCANAGVLADVCPNAVPKVVDVTGPNVVSPAGVCEPHAVRAPLVGVARPPEAALPNTLNADPQPWADAAGTPPRTPEFWDKFDDAIAAPPVGTPPKTPEFWDAVDVFPPKFWDKALAP